MMKKTLIALSIITILPNICNSAQQTISGGAGVLWGAEKAKLNSNFTEIYGRLGQAVNTNSNPSFNSVHATGGNLAAANVQVTKQWITGLPYVADVSAAIYDGNIYICVTSHTAGTFATDLSAGRWKLWGAVVATVRTTAGGGSTTSAPNEAAVGDALAAKQDDLAVPSQAEAEAGTATTERAWTAERVKQAIVALGGSGTPEVVDETFNATNFYGDTTSGVSQDDFYSRMHLFDADDDGSFTDEAWFPSTSGAPTNATYVTLTDQTGLSADQNLGLLTTGLLKNTVTAGTAVLSTAVAGTDYQAPLTAGTSYLRPTTDVDDTPVNGETAQPVSSNWAYDHVAAADPHTGYVLESSLGTGMQTFFTTPSGANLAATLTTALPASKGGTGLTALSANVVSYLGAADYAAMRTLLALTIGTNVQAYDADLTYLSGFTPTANVKSILNAADYAAIKALLFSTGGIYIPGTASGGQYVQLLEDTDNGTNYTGLAAPGSITNSQLFSWPATTPVAGSLLTFGTGGSQTMSDSTTKTVIPIAENTTGTGVITAIGNAVNTSGGLLTSAAIDDTPDNGSITTAPSANWAYDHETAADPHTGYVLESAIGSTVQAYDADLTAWGAIPPATGNIETTGTLQGNMVFNSYAAATTLTAANHNASVVQMTVAGEVTMWDCETAGIGNFVMLWARDAEKIEVVPASGDHFNLFAGTALTVNYELDIAATAGTKVTLMCTADDTWSVYSETAASTDGGAAD